VKIAEHTTIQASLLLEPESIKTLSSSTKITGGIYSFSMAEGNRHIPIHIIRKWKDPFRLNPSIVLSIKITI